MSLAFHPQSDIHSDCNVPQGHGWGQTMQLGPLVGLGRVYLQHVIPYNSEGDSIPGGLRSGSPVFAFICF